MTITYVTAVANNRLNVVRDAIDAGAGPGIIEIGTAGMGTVLVTFSFNDPSAPNAAGKVLTFSGFPKSANPTASGTAAAARVRDSTNADVGTGLTVGTAGTDIILNTTTIQVGIPVTLTSATITHP
jgi:hypothetical protein